VLSRITNHSTSHGIIPTTCFNLTHSRITISPRKPCDIHGARNTITHALQIGMVQTTDHIHVYQTDPWFRRMRTAHVCAVCCRLDTLLVLVAVYLHIHSCNVVNNFTLQYVITFNAHKGSHTNTLPPPTPTPHPPRPPTSDWP